MSLCNRPNGPVSIAASSTGQATLSTQTGQPPVFPQTIVLSGTVETVIPHPQQAAAPWLIPVPGNEGNEQVGWDLYVSGYIVTTNTTNVTIKVYSGTSLTVGSDTQLATSGAIAQNTLSAPFEMHLHFVYDSVSGKMGGYFEGFINNTLVAKAALSNVVTGLKDSISPVLNLLLSATSSAASGPNPTTVVVKNFTAG
jgi:hypothetical protein